MTIRQVTERYPAFTETALRWQLLNRNDNGLCHSVVKVGKRVFFDRIEFEKWLENQREEEKTHGN
jgi:hypothetical protein